MLRGVAHELETTQTANVQQQTRRLLAKRARSRKGGTRPLAVGDLAYVAEASNKGFKAKVMGPYVVTGLGESTVQLRSSAATAVAPVHFERHVSQVARATTLVDVQEKLLRDAGHSLDFLADYQPDDLLDAHVATRPCPTSRSAVCNLD